MIFSATVAILILAILILLSLVRLIIGPTTPDRVVAMDTIGTLTVALMILLGLVYRQTVFVDVAIVYALLSYVGTLFIARYMGREDR